MIDRMDRRAELIAAAAADELTTVERAELAELAAADPTVETEIAELRSTGAMVGSLRDWDRPTAGADLRASMLAAAGASGARRPAVWIAVAGAAACLAIGAAVGVVGSGLADAPPTGPPGTLGAIEAVDFVGEPDGVTVDGELVAHTWGTETVLQVAGMPVGESFEVVLIARDGAEYPSGSFLGSTVPIDCRMNAALAREDLADVEIRDASGAVVSAAHAPRAG